MKRGVRLHGGFYLAQQHRLAPVDSWNRPLGPMGSHGAHGAHEPMDTMSPWANRAHGPMGLWVNKPMPPWAHGPMSPWAHGPMGRWSLGPGTWPMSPWSRREKPAGPAKLARRAEQARPQPAQPAPWHIFQTILIDCCQYLFQND